MTDEELNDLQIREEQERLANRSPWEVLFDNAFSAVILLGCSDGDPSDIYKKLGEIADYCTGKQDDLASLLPDEDPPSY